VFLILSHRKLLTADKGIVVSLIPNIVKLCSLVRSYCGTVRETHEYGTKRKIFLTINGK
jgi:hypothetical protein